MGLIRVNAETYGQFAQFNHTLFSHQLLNKEFVYFIAENGDELVKYIYAHGDMRFAEALIKNGVKFEPGQLIFAQHF